MKNLKNIILLESVGSALVDGIVYPLNVDGTIDYDVDCELGDCLEDDDWFNSLSDDDYHVVKEEILKNIKIETVKK